MNIWDVWVIVLYFVLIFSIAIYYMKAAGKNTSEFFLSGRNLPWWLAGTAMVATTFAADTPLAVTELVARNGIAGNWLWWNLAIGGMLTVFFFAKLWRRANILTDVEFTELRYSGKAAAALRGIRAIYLGFLMNIIVMAWVNKAMQKIVQVLFPNAPDFLIVAGIMLVIAIYASASGLLGTARIDSLQFVIAMIGTIILAIIVVSRPEVGGISGLKAKLPDWVFKFTPKIGDSGSLKSTAAGILALSSGAFFAYIGLQWWASWYPGADPGGGGYVAQRMMSAKDEKHSLLATLWFIIAHYCIRPWPWIIVALVSLVIFPDLPTVDKGKGFIMLMNNYLPSGLKGLLIASFLAAYMSTISSQLNWGTSYIINDFYRRFVKKNENEKHYVLISRISIIILTILSLLVTKYLLQTISGAWEFVINASAGIGAVLILRWYWWRINAWSEISALTAPLIIYPISKYYFHLDSPITLYPTVFGTTIVWIIVTFLTKPVDSAKLSEFYKRVHPGGWGWKAIAKQHPEIKPDRGYLKLFAGWIAGIFLVYSALFGTGYLIFGEFINSLIAYAILALSILVILRVKPWEKLA